jgi:hypothetical protein
LSDVVVFTDTIQIISQGDRLALTNIFCTNENVINSKFNLVTKLLSRISLTIITIYHAIKLADFVGTLMYCSINEAVARCFSSRAISAGVLPSSSLAFGSAPASMRALMI